MRRVRSRGRPNSSADVHGYQGPRLAGRVGPEPLLETRDPTRACSVRCGVDIDDLHRVAVAVCSGGRVDGDNVELGIAGDFDETD